MAKHRGAAVLAILVGPLTATAAFASPPGAGLKVYGPNVEKGVAEIEFRGSRFAGGAEGGEGVFVYEAAYSVADWWRVGVVYETENEPQGPVKLEEVGIENIFELPRIPGVPIDFGAYGEYEFGVNGEADAIELRWLAQNVSGPIKTRFNFNVTREFENGARFEFGYGAISSVEVFDDFRLGVEAFGDFGDTQNFGSLSRREQYVGPVALFEIEPEWLPGEMEVESGYLFGVAGAEAEGEIRLLLEWEFKL